MKPEALPLVNLFWGIQVHFMLCFYEKQEKTRLIQKLFVSL